MCALSFHAIKSLLEIIIWTFSDVVCCTQKIVSSQEAQDLLDEGI